MAIPRFDFPSLPFFGRNDALNVRLKEAAYRLDEKLEEVFPRLEEMGTSAYSLRYMNNVFGHASRRRANLTKYAHILSNALEPFDVDALGSISMADYGGGHGTLGLLAREVGVGRVFHSDVNSISSNDARNVAAEIGLSAEAYFVGDSDHFREELEARNTKLDAIANYDVIEHVYNLGQYFVDLSAVTKKGGRWFMGSGANPYNAKIRKQLLEIHDELEVTGNKNRPTPYRKMRRSLIEEHEPSLLPEEVDKLMDATRGWRKEDILRAVDIYRSSGHVVSFCPPYFNTSDPRNGNWGENLISKEFYLQHPVLKNVARRILDRTERPVGPLLRPRQAQTAGATNDSPSRVQAAPQAGRQAAGRHAIRSARRDQRDARASSSLRVAPSVPLLCPEGRLLTARATSPRSRPRSRSDRGSRSSPSTPYKYLQEDIIRLAGDTGFSVPDHHFVDALWRRVHGR